MSATFSNIVPSGGSRKSRAQLPLLGIWWKGIERYFVHRAAIARLRELDDGALDDIGLERFQIEAAVRGLAISPKRPTT